MYIFCCIKKTIVSKIRNATFLILFVLLNSNLTVRGQDSVFSNQLPLILIDSGSSYFPPVQKSFIAIEVFSRNDYNQPWPSIKFILDGQPDSLRNIFLLQLKVDSSEFNSVESTIRSGYRSTIEKAHEHGGIAFMIVRDFKVKKFLFYNKESIKTLLDEISSGFKNSENENRLDSYLSQMLSTFGLSLANYAPDTSYKWRRKADCIQSSLDRAGDSIYSGLSKLKRKIDFEVQEQYHFKKDTTCPDDCENLRCCSEAYIILDTTSHTMKVAAVPIMSSSDNNTYRLYFDNDKLVKAIVFANEKLVFYYSKEENEIDNSILQTRTFKIYGWKYELLRKARFWLDRYK